jgi:hypothetical protein
MTIREDKQELRLRILTEVIKDIEGKPISLGELTRKFNDNVKDIYKLVPLEISHLLRLVKEYKKYTSNQGNTSYIFIKWKRPKRQCRHCGKLCDGKICRECFKRKHTGSVSRAISRRKNGRL